MKSNVLPPPDLIIRKRDHWWLTTLEQNERRLAPAVNPEHRNADVARLLQEAGTARDESDLAAILQRLTDLCATLAPRARERIHAQVADAIRELALEQQQL
jgi:hypothetical protein